MLTTQTLANNLLAAYNGDNWTDVCLRDTLTGISWQQALSKTPASVNTIAGLVHHLQFWNKVIGQRLQGLHPEIPENNGFETGDIGSEDEWQQLIADTAQSFSQLAERIRSFPEEKMEELSANGRSTYGQNIYGIIEHAYYHIGQIVILKKMIGLQQ